MDTEGDLTGRLALLPSDEIVTIETVYPDGFAAARRKEGPRAETIAICAISSLRDIEPTRIPDDA